MEEKRIKVDSAVGRITEKAEKKSDPRSGALTAIMTVLTVIYALFMVYLMFFRSRGGMYGSYIEYVKSHINPIPFEIITRYIIRLTEGTINTDTVVINLLGNIVMFIPLGVIIPFFASGARGWFKTAAFAAVVMALVETAQLLTARGTFDVDDIILNTLGAAIGYAVFAAVRCAFCSVQRRKERDAV